MADTPPISGHLEGVEQTIARLKSIPDRARPEVVKTVGRLAIELQGDVKANYLSGQALKTRTGTLRRSITQRVVETDYDVIGIVGTNVRYGRIWEKGGTIPGYSRLVTMAWGRQVKNPKMANWRPRAVQARPYLKPALQAKATQIKEDLKNAVLKGAAA